MKKIIICISILLLLLFSQCNSEKAINKSALEYKWIINPRYPRINLNIDSITKPNSLLLETLGKEKGRISTLIPIYQENKKSSNLKIRIRYKVNACKEFILKATSIGQCEDINSIDTIQLPLSKEWIDLTNTIAIKKPFLLNISLEAKGSEEGAAKIWISHLDIFPEDKNSFDKPPHKTQEKNLDLRKWQEKNLKDFPFFRKKILAIGESIHGTQTMNNIAISIWKERILKGQCKYVLLEIPLEFSLYINRYVQNDPNFKFEDISSYFDYFLFSDSMLSFIKWLREYNLKKKRKVSFLGFDLNYVRLKSKTDLFNFLHTLNSNKHIKEIDTICKTLLNSEKKSLDKVISMCKNNTNLNNLLNEEEYKLLLHCLKITKQESSSYFRFIKRDEYMNEITSFIIDNFLKENETITIFGHLGHVNYLTGQDMVVTDDFSFGHYMKKKYKDDYSCTAIITNEGSVLLSKNSSKFETVKLTPSTPESIEYILNKSNKDSLYLSMNNVNCSDFLKTRLLGSHKDKNNAFRYFIPKVRFDDVLFVRTSTCSKKKKELLKKDLNYNAWIMNSYIDALQKIKKKDVVRASNHHKKKEKD